MRHAYRLYIACNWRRCSLLTLALLIFVFSTTIIMAQSPPVAPLKNVVDRHFGIDVVDPYRYMENFSDAAVQAWVKGQAQHAAQTLHAIAGRDALLKRIQELDAGKPFSLTGVTRHHTGDSFYFKRLAGENIAKVYVRDGRTGEEKLLIDPDSFPRSSPEDHFSVSFFRVSPNGLLVLYGYAASGSELTSIKIFDRASGKDLPDVIDRIEAEYALPSWFPDSKSFAYSRRRMLPADAPPTEGYKFTQAFRHMLGEDVDQDPMLFAQGVTGSPTMGEMDFPAILLPTGSAWAIGQVKHGDETDISLYATRRETLGTPNVTWTKICNRTDLVTDFDVRGEDIYLLTAIDAPRFQVIRTSLDKPDMAAANIILPGGEYVVDSVAVAEDSLYVGIREGVLNRILRVPYDASAPIERIELPSEEPSGSIVAAGAELPGIFVSTRSWSREGNLYFYDPESGKLTSTNLLPTGKFDHPDWLTSTEVMVPSHDGVQVPLSIVHRKDIQLDGSHPTLISGYGAYGHSAHISFDPISLAWLEKGGVLATAHIRGGGTFGKAWHHAGRKLTKPNTWKDFIACAEYLVEKKYTSPAKLAGQGGSAGGILIGRAITERPDLFAAARIAVGCTDMMRFETTMNGPPNVPEFGTIAKEDEFRALLAMSTLHHIVDGTKYPAVLLTHGINDPRVEPWMSAKTTARLQAASGSGKPVIFRVDYHAGHGIGSTRSQRQEELADMWSFFLWQFGEQGFEGK